MLNLDPGKLLVIGVVAIILLGPDRLPQVAKRSAAPGGPSTNSGTGWRPRCATPCPICPTPRRSPGWPAHRRRCSTTSPTWLRTMSRTAPSNRRTSTARTASAAVADDARDGRARAARPTRRRRPRRGRAGTRAGAAGAAARTGADPRRTTTTGSQAVGRGRSRRPDAELRLDRGHHSLHGQTKEPPVPGQHDAGGASRRTPSPGDHLRHRLRHRRDRRCHRLPTDPELPAAPPLQRRRTTVHHNAKGSSLAPDRVERLVQPVRDVTSRRLVAAREDRALRRPRPGVADHPVPDLALRHAGAQGDRAQVRHSVRARAPSCSSCSVRRRPT